MKVFGTITVELEVEGSGQVDNAQEYIYAMVSHLRFNHATPPAGVTFEDVHRPIIEWE